MCIRRVCVSPVCVCIICVYVCVRLLRSVSLADTNALLREQLSRSEQVNQCLREDLQKLTSDWTRAVEEVEQKENDWQRERKVCSTISLIWAFDVF